LQSAPQKQHQNNAGDLAENSCSHKNRNKKMDNLSRFYSYDPSEKKYPMPKSS
jgi:hypothetical protein